MRMNRAPVRRAIERKWTMRQMHVATKDSTDGIPPVIILRIFHGTKTLRICTVTSSAIEVGLRSSALPL